MDSSQSRVTMDQYTGYGGRKKSCAECRKSKARCSLGSPCRRCEERSLTCKYQHSTARAGRRLRPATDARERRREPEPILEDPWPLQMDPPILAGAMTSLTEELPMTTPSHDIGSPGNIFSLDWDTAMPSLALQTGDMSSLLGLSLPGLPSPKSIQPSGPLLRPDHPALDLTCPTINQEPPAPTMLRAFYDKSPLAPRTTGTVATCFTAKVLLGQLFSYPRMLGTGGKLPPFIFPSCALDGLAAAAECCAPGYHRCLPEALAICSGLMRAYETRTSGNTSYLWKNIYAEVERLTGEYMTYTATQLLEALQAVVIYLLLQASDRESINDNNLVTMLIAPKRIGGQLDQIIGTCESGLRMNLGLDRRRWVLYESTRRTICVLFGIGILIDVDLGGGDSRNCDGYGSVPLPCERSLWDPVSGAEWTARYKASSWGAAQRQMRRDDDVLTIRDLRRARRALGVEATDDSEEGRLVARMSEWCENLDDFGMMVWMAVMMG